MTNVGTIKELTNLAGGTVTVTNPAGSQFAEDAAHVSGDGGNLVFGVANTAGSNFVGTVGDYTPLALTQSGQQYIATVTTVDTVTTVSNLTNGSVRLTVGTITTGSLTDLANLYNGSVRMTVGTVTTGSLTDLANLYNGSVRMTVGTLTTGTLQNLVSGTLNALASGTITAGTVVVSNLPGATDPKFSYQTSAALAAAALATLSFTSITNAKTGQLQKVMMASSVPIRGEVQRIEDTGGTVGTAGVVFTSAAHPTVEWEAPADNFFTQVSTGTAKFRAVITNMDNALAADVYATAFWDEVTT